MLTKRSGLKSLPTTTQASYLNLSAGARRVVTDPDGQGVGLSEVARAKPAFEAVPERRDPAGFVVGGPT